MLVNTYVSYSLFLSLPRISLLSLSSVDKLLDQHDLPYDVLWLDIEHTDGKKYFTWDKTKFPNPIEMQNKIASKGRKVNNVIIINN